MPSRGLGLQVLNSWGPLSIKATVGLDLVALVGVLDLVPLPGGFVLVGSSLLMISSMVVNT